MGPAKMSQSGLQGEWSLTQGFTVYFVYINVPRSISQVQIQVGRDKGKVGIINSIIKERNWAFVEGLNNVSTPQGHALV